MRGWWLMALTGCSLQWGYDRVVTSDAGRPDSRGSDGAPSATPDAAPDATPSATPDAAPSATPDAAADAGPSATQDAAIPVPGAYIPSSGTFAVPQSYATDTNPVAIAIGDFNGDGRPDVAVANNKNQGSNVNTISTVSVLLANANGTLQTAVQYTVGYGPTGIVSGDFNGDGALDLVTTNEAAGMGGNATILLGTGTGTFGTSTIVAACCSPEGLAAGDLDADGKLDLVVANYHAAQVLLGNGNGTFAAPVSYALPASSWSVAIGDVDNNGKLDVVAGYNVYPNPDSVAVLRGNGDGTLQTATTYNTGKGLNRLALADLDADANLDVITANISGTSDISVLRGTGTGQLLAATHYAMGSATTQAVVVDVNGDGKLDVAASAGDSNTVVVRLGNGDATFGAQVAYMTQSVPLAVATADLNGDRRADLVVANGASNSVSVLLGQP